MFIKDWMTRDPIVVTSDTPIMEAQKILRENKIRRLPVVDKGELVGIVTYRSLIEASPSDATSLSMHELNYLLAKLKVGDIMTRELITVSPNDTVEHCALLGHEKGVGCVLVVDRGRLVGIATESDIFRTYVAMLGAKEELERITLTDVDVVQGTIGQIAKLVEDKGGTVISIFSIPQKGSDLRMVVLRIKAKKIRDIKEALRKAGYNIER